MSRLTKKIRSNNLSMNRIYRLTNFFSFPFWFDRKVFFKIQITDTILTIKI